MYLFKLENVFVEPDQISLGLQTSHPSAAYIHHGQTTQDLSHFQIKSLDPTRVVLHSLFRKQLAPQNIYRWSYGSKVTMDRQHVLSFRCLESLYSLLLPWPGGKTIILIKCSIWVKVRQTNMEYHLTFKRYNHADEV